MSKVVVNLSLTLDGVMQAPGRPERHRVGTEAYREKLCESL